MESIVHKLFEIDAIKFGNFTLKSKLTSPMYFDLRVIVSYPEVLESICDFMYSRLKSEDMLDPFGVICGVPYTALPIATVISVKHKLPMVLKRKEAKKYGTGNMIEGHYRQGFRCLVIEDVVTSGSSILETAECLKQHGLIVTHAICIIDRGQGGREMLQTHNINLLSLIKMDEMLTTLESCNRITSQRKLEVEQYIQANNTFNPGTKNETISPKFTSPILSKLKEIIQKKKSNLCLSADMSSGSEILEAADAMGPSICMIKTHIDCLKFNSLAEISEFTSNLKCLSEKHNFLIMEDRKFADIGSTVQKQLGENSIYQISKWADLVTLHGIPGPGILDVFKTLNKSIGVVLIAEMSSKGNLCGEKYKEQVMDLASQYPDIVIGAVSQKKTFTDELIQFTPGVKFMADFTGDGLGQQYCSVQSAIIDQGADVIIVGRGIIQNEKSDWAQIAEQYKEEGWNALKSRKEQAQNKL